MNQLVPSWSRLVMDHESVPEHRRMRTDRDDIVQFVDGEAEYLAVHGIQPYGVLSESRLGIRFLPLVETTAEYTTFAVPEEVLTLVAITLGTGRRHGDLLLDTYRKVGETAHKIIATFDGKFPITVQDFAVDRGNGDLLLVPPILPNTEAEERDPLRVLSDSVHEQFDGTFGTYIVPLIDELMVGYESWG